VLQTLVNIQEFVKTDSMDTLVLVLMDIPEETVKLISMNAMRMEIPA